MSENYIYGGNVTWKKDEWRDIIGHDYVEDAGCKDTTLFCPTTVLEEMELDSDKFDLLYLNKNDKENYVYNGSKTWEEIIEIAKECCDWKPAV